MEELTMNYFITEFKGFSKLRKIIFIVASLQLVFITIYIGVLYSNNLVETLLQIILCYCFYIIFPCQQYLINNTKIFYIDPKDWTIK
jgi:hypothetical protein